MENDELRSLSGGIPGRARAGWGRMTAYFAALLLLVSGCVVAVHPGPYYRVLSAEEAVAISAQFARSRGLLIDRTLDARLDSYERWHVDLAGNGGHDTANVLVDGYSGRVVWARLRNAGGDLAPPGSAPPPPSTPPEPPPSSPPPPPSSPPPPPPA